MPSFPADLAFAPVRSEFADDPDFQDLLVMFVESLQEQRREIVAAYEADDLMELARKAHQLKGAGGGYGFPGLSETARRFEEACASQDAAIVTRGLNDLLAYIDRMVSR